jgi:SNF2 family DNA or RNA helicase
MRLARDRNLPYPRILIITPGSVMSNWAREFNAVIGNFLALAHGSGDGGILHYFMDLIK